jgi:hypothetical protein
MWLTASVRILSSSVDRLAVFELRLAGHASCGSFLCSIGIE